MEVVASLGRNDEFGANGSGRVVLHPYFTYGGVSVHCSYSVSGVGQLLFVDRGRVVGSLPDPWVGASRLVPR